VRGRGGIAAVELALCLPVLVVLALGAIETCNIMYVRARMYSAAYEAARYATRPTTAATLAASSPQTASNAVTNYCTTLLGQLGVNGAAPTLQVLDHSTSQSKSITAANPMDLVTVSVSAPLSQNYVTAYVINTSMTLNASATLIVE
jgi:Flp pilus assembly protein TadG